MELARLTLAHTSAPSRVTFLEILGLVNLFHLIVQLLPLRVLAEGGHHFGDKERVGWHLKSSFDEGGDGIRLHGVLVVDQIAGGRSIGWDMNGEGDIAMDRGVVFIADFAVSLIIMQQKGTPAATCAIAVLGEQDNGLGGMARWKKSVEKSETLAVAQIVFLELLHLALVIVTPLCDSKSP